MKRKETGHGGQVKVAPAGGRFSVIFFCEWCWGGSGFFSLGCGLAESEVGRSSSRA